jgi:hypothetical protein
MGRAHYFVRGIRRNPADVTVSDNAERRRDGPSGGDRPPGEYYDDYYAVFFLDPDGLKLEGVKYGERQARAARVKAKRG